MVTKTFVTVQYDYANPWMVATFQTSTNNEDGTFTYGSYDAPISANDQATILAIVTAL